MLQMTITTTKGEHYSKVLNPDFNPYECCPEKILPTGFYGDIVNGSDLANFYQNGIMILEQSRIICIPPQQIEKIEYNIIDAEKF